ncbi:aldo/keto reductase [Streptomyces sp. NPDC001260]|uniref:aldo/keto reductase n=1 Tax=Streptomyces sp. NPDC001260 TaxID=3364551 RepID=UPI0036BBCA91
MAFVLFAVSDRRREAAAGREHDARIHSVADAHHATPAQVRLAWTLHRGPHVLALPGTRNPAHPAQNIVAASLRLTEEELALLSTAGRPAAASGIAHMVVGTGTGRRPGAGGSSSETRATTAAITTPGHMFLDGRDDAVQRPGTTAFPRWP